MSHNEKLKQLIVLQYMYILQIPKNVYTSLSTFTQKKLNCKLINNKYVQKCLSSKPKCVQNNCRFTINFKNRCTAIQGHAKLTLILKVLRMPTCLCLAFFGLIILLSMTFLLLCHNHPNTICEPLQSRHYRRLHQHQHEKQQQQHSFTATIIA